MKVLMINSVCGIRSTGRICTDIADGLIAQGHEVKIAYGREQIPQRYKDIAVRIGSDLGVKINALKCRLFDNDGFAAKAQTKKFLKWANNYNPDVLWLHNLHGYYINVEMLFAWIKSKPNMKVKWTLHDCWAFTGHCAYFTMAQCSKWQEQCEQCLQKKNYPTSYLADNSAKNYIRKKKAFCGVNDLTIITPSKWLAGLVKESFLGEYNVEVLYNKIDLNAFKPTPSDFKERHGIQNKKIILGVASVWGKRKGFDDFLKLSELIDDNYRIVLVGVDKQQLKMLPKNAIGIERTNNVKELAEIYTAADVFFNPTYEDNYPTVNLEAQACGTKVVTYDTGGSSETIYSDNAVIIPTGCLNDAIQHF